MRKSFTYNGKRYYVTRSNPKELEQAIADKKAELKYSVTESDIRVSEYIDKWIDTFKKPYIDTGSLKMYKSSANVVISYIGNLKMKDVSSFQLQNIVTSETKKGRSKSYIDKTILVMRGVFKRAYEDGLISRNPAANIIKPKLDYEVGRPLTKEELKTFLEVCKTNAHGEWALTMLMLGLRPSETALLLVSDYDADSHTIHVRGTKTKKADRYIPCPEKVAEIFNKRLGQVYMFETRNGQPPNAQRRRKWWANIKRDMDIKLGAVVYRNQIIESKLADDLEMYCLRHTFATEMSAHVPINVLADLLGHSDINITRYYYIGKNEQNFEAARNLMEKAFRL